jgi:integrase
VAKRIVILRPSHRKPRRLRPSRRHGIASFGFLRRTVRIPCIRSSAGGFQFTKIIAKIENEVTEWVEKGVQATTDKRLVFLRAILYHACEKTKKINLGDIPYFLIRGKATDNVRQGKFPEADFSNILEELPKYLHPLVKFLHLTGMRSGQAKAITWDMIGDDNVRRMPGFLTKNGQPLPFSRFLSPNHIQVFPLNDESLSNLGAH